MRYTLRSALSGKPRVQFAHGAFRETRKSRLLGWWGDWPPRHRRFWYLLLLQSGDGWLRWGIEERTGYDYIPDAMASAPYPFSVAPPLRQTAIFLHQCLLVPRLMLRGVEDVDGDPGRYRFSWEEARPCWPCLDDPDRNKELWEL